MRLMFYLLGYVLGVLASGFALYFQCMLFIWQTLTKGKSYNNGINLEDIVVGITILICIIFFIYCSVRVVMTVKKMNKQ